MRRDYCLAVACWFIFFAWYPSTKGRSRPARGGYYCPPKIIGFLTDWWRKLHKTIAHIIVIGLPSYHHKRIGGPAQTRTEIPIFDGVDSFQLSYAATNFRRRLK